MTRLTTAVLFATLTIGGVLMKAFLVRDKPTTAQLLWHNEEVFLFVGQNLVGWRLNYLMLALSTLSPYGPPSQNVQRSMTVVTITPTAIERRRFDGSLPPDLAIADGRVSTLGGAWWTGERFDPDRHRLPDQLANKYPQEFSDVEGWSKRSLVIPGERAIDMVLGGRSVRLLATTDAGNPVFDLDRGDGKRERLWSAETSTRWLSAREYDALFTR